MPSVADCLRQHGREFLEHFGDRVTLQQRKVLSAVTRCRTGELGSVIYDCRDCQREHWVGRSCGNRHCPSCQHEKTQQWLQKQSDRLLPVHYFLVTFTVPQEVRSLLRGCPQEGYDALFNAGSQTIRDLLKNSKWLGSDQVGFFGVLHTWGRDPMVYHPHVHFVVPGGGVSADGTQWLATPTNFLFPEPCASPVYRQKFREELRFAGLEKYVDPAVWHRWWEVDVTAVGNGQSVLKYLAPYVFRVAISDKRIEACTETSVTYSYTPSKSKKARTRTVPGDRFVRGFLQHVLPKGFRKVRHYGWCASNSRNTLDRVRWLVWLWLGWTYWLRSRVSQEQTHPAPPAPRCKHCGGELRLRIITDADGRILLNRTLPNHRLTYLDSG